VGQVGAQPTDQSHVQLLLVPKTEKLVDRCWWQEQRSNEIRPRGRLVRNVIGQRLGEWGESGREDRGVVEQPLEQCAFGGSLGPVADGLLGPWHGERVPSGAHDLEVL